jgi:hypothetical protein
VAGPITRKPSGSVRLLGEKDNDATISLCRKGRLLSIRCREGRRGSHYGRRDAEYAQVSLVISEFGKQQIHQY